MKVNGLNYMTIKKSKYILMTISIICAVICFIVIILIDRENISFLYYFSTFMYTFSLFYFCVNLMDIIDNLDKSFKKCNECGKDLEGCFYSVYLYKRFKKYEGPYDDQYDGQGALVKCICTKCGKENFINLEFGKSSENIPYQIQKFMDKELHTIKIIEE